MSDLETEFRTEFARRYKIRFPRFEPTESGITSIMACGEAQVARQWFTAGWNKAKETEAQK